MFIFPRGRPEEVGSQIFGHVTCYKSELAAISKKSNARVWWVGVFCVERLSCLTLVLLPLRH